MKLRTENQQHCNTLWAFGLNVLLQCWSCDNSIFKMCFGDCRLILLTKYMIPKLIRIDQLFDQKNHIYVT